MRRFFMVSVIWLMIVGTVFGAEYPLDQGSVMISGMFSFTNSIGDLYEDFEGNSATVFTLAPSWLSFVARNVALGGNLSFTSASQGRTSATAPAIGPKLGFFVGTPESKTYPFFGMGISYLRHTFSWEWYDPWDGSRSKEEATADGTKVYFGAGVVSMISSHLAIIFEGSYNLDSLKPEHGTSTSGSMVGVAVGLAGFVF